MTGVPGVVDLFAGGAGFSLSPNAITGPSRSGDISGSYFGGIQTGGSGGGMPMWLALGAMALMTVMVLRK